MKTLATTLMLLTLTTVAVAGPYSGAEADPTNPYDAGIPGYVGPSGDGEVTASNTVNPDFIGWATGHSDGVDGDGGAHTFAAGKSCPDGNHSDPNLRCRFNGTNDGNFDDPTDAYYSATGNTGDVFTLGDLDKHMIDAGITTPGRITMTFDVAIRNGVGADLAVFENGLMGDDGEIMAELAYVEVSTYGDTFVRFPSVSLTPETEQLTADNNDMVYDDWDGTWVFVHPGWSQETIDPTGVYNLAGKHRNSGDTSWGTPFDLDDLANDPAVMDGTVDLNDIQYVRIVDIPGNGDWVDSLGNPIYDAWVTRASGGFDLEAIGVLNEMPNFNDDETVTDVDFDLLADEFGSTDRQYDLDHSGIVDADDLTYMIEECLEWARDGQSGWGTFAGDFNLDGVVDLLDLNKLTANYNGSAGWVDGDANGDGMVDLLDLNKLTANYNATVVVPEPATMSLMALAGVALLRRRR
jgi:hypothetical protein